MLGELGLSAAAERVYWALSDDPSMDWMLLAARLGLPQATVGQVLYELADLGLLRVSCKDPGRRFPVAPQVAFALLARAEQDRLDRRQQALNRARAQADALAQAEVFTWHDLPAGVEKLSDPDVVHNRAQAMAVSAQGEFSLIVPPSDMAEGFGPLVAQTATRCALKRVIVSEAMREEPVTAAYARLSAEAGAQFRTAGELPGRLLIADRAAALAQADPLDPCSGNIMITASAVVDAFSGVFDRIWAGARPLDAVPPAAVEREPCASERELLKMMSDGLTDAAAAKRLGVSHSTAQRRVEALMHRLDASSRFQAGVNAHARGWLQP